MRRTIDLNRNGDRRGAKHYLTRELKWMEPYARALPDSESLLAELLLRRADEEMDPRTRKDVFAGSMMRMRTETDMRSEPRRSMAEVLRKKGST